MGAGVTAVKASTPTPSGSPTPFLPLRGKHTTVNTRLFLIAAVVLTFGCQPPRPAPDRQPARVRLEPEEDLRRVFGRYRTAAAYRDVAVATVQAVTPDDRGRPRTERRSAPIGVDYRSGSKLAVDAYDVRLRCEAGGTDGPMRRWQQTVRFVDTSGRDVAEPVERTWQAAADRAISLDEVLADQSVADAVAGGPAGPPPQLEWLLSADPMATLFDDQTRFERLPDDELHDRTHRRVAATTAGRRYTFWIDEATGVIARVELPIPTIPRTTPQDPVIESLTLEMREATFSPAVAVVE